MADRFNSELHARDASVIGDYFRDLGANLRDNRVLNPFREDWIGYEAGESVGGKPGRIAAELALPLPAAKLKWLGKGKRAIQSMQRAAEYFPAAARSPKSAEAAAKVLDSFAAAGKYNHGLWGRTVHLFRNTVYKAGDKTIEKVFNAPSGMAPGGFRRLSNVAVGGAEFYLPFMAAGKVEAYFTEKEKAAANDEAGKKANAYANRVEAVSAQNARVAEMLEARSDPVALAFAINSRLDSYEKAKAGIPAAAIAEVRKSRQAGEALTDAQLLERVAPIRDRMIAEAESNLVADVKGFASGTAWPKLKNEQIRTMVDNGGAGFELKSGERVMPADLDAWAASMKDASASEEDRASAKARYDAASDEIMAAVPTGGVDEVYFMGRVPGTERRRR